MTSEALETDGSAPTRESRAWVEWFWRANNLRKARRELGEQSAVSEDAQHWVEVARRKEVFDTWRAVFPPQSARYVRARVTRNTFLHLVRMSVYEK